MRAAAYVRVSTDQQRTDSQRAELRDWARREGIELKFYADRGVSGSKDRRPALDRLVRDVEAGKLDLVLASKLDRLGRSLRHVVDLVEQFRAAGVGVVIPGQGIDTRNDSPVGNLVLGVLGAAAEFERAVIVERVRAGLAAKRATGWKPAGRAPRLRGVEVTAVRERHARGESIASLARDLTVSRSAVRTALK